jgi:putative pyruvate formate lyase activating enzyme
MENPYSPCVLCPRCCGVDRLNGKKGFCGETAILRLASASIHRGEEPPLTGRGGSGTVFVSGCTLGCSFCQNYQISRNAPDRKDSEPPSFRTLGRPVSIGEAAAVFLALQKRGAENINIVTGSHAVPALAESISAARRRGLSIPVLWNSSAYETPQTLRLLKDAVSVWLPDLKTLDARIGERLFNAPDYPEAAEKAINAMLEMQGRLEYRDGLLQKGVIIRHLVLPGHLQSTEKVLRWFARHAKDRALLSVMTQYTPVAASRPPETAPSGFVSSAEYKTVLGWLEKYCIEKGFVQELVRDELWLPDFTRPNPFSSALSVPVWPWTRSIIESLI